MRCRTHKGFSINGDILLPNQLCESIVAQRIVYEGILKAGGVTQVDISSQMVKDVKGSHRRYNLSAMKEAVLNADKEILELQEKLRK